MWTKGNYRRVFLDMHIDDWNEAFLGKLDPGHIVSVMKDAGAQNIVVKAKPHTGLCYWKCSTGRMHRGLKGRDYVAEMTGLCRENGIAATVYYSQIFDNWAYDRHPSWRCVYVDGLSSREKEHHFFRKGRYGVVCANNPEYRAYVRANLRELVRNYRFEGMFLDMPFWPEVCYCPSCKERYLREAGREMPKTVDWDDEGWRAFQAARERWMGEFAAFSTGCIREINPDVTVEHNFAVALFPWQFATTDLVMDACDYAGGDYYGGYLQQTFACKYYRNVSPSLPFEYITSRCDPDLIHHTTTKTGDEFIQHAVTALVHDGAFSLCDGMNPDGTIQADVYRGTIKRVFGETAPYEKYVGGKPVSNVSILFATHSKFGAHENGQAVGVLRLDVEGFAHSKVRMAAILRENHIPFDVVAARNLKHCRDDVLVLSDVGLVRDEEMAALEAYVVSGGSLYVSGRIGHTRLYELLEIGDRGWTEHAFTYMAPTDKGAALFEGFGPGNPLTVNAGQHLVQAHGACDVLATITLPYTAPGTQRFASIHSDPPGIHTDWPAILLKKVGAGRILWLAAPIEASRPYGSRKVVANLVRSLCGELRFTANAPGHVEVLAWEKEEKLYLAAINQQESAPVAPVYDVSIEIPGKISGAQILGRQQEAAVACGEGRTRISLPRIDLFTIVEVRRTL